MEHAQLQERTKYTSVQFKVDAPGSAPAVCAEDEAGRTAEVKASQPLPLPSDGASAERAAEAMPHEEAPPPPADASGHTEAWLAELPHMNLF